MNFLHLGHRLGAVSSATLQRSYNEHAIYSLEHDERVTFSLARLAGDVPSSANVAHNNGVNALALRSDILATAGADACIRLWDLSRSNPPSSNTATYHPLATLTRSPTAHINALTSISIYPFDPTPTTLLSTSFDTNLLLTSITPSSLQPVHTFNLTHAVYTHAVSPIPSTSPLVAAGTASPTIRLLDLRSGLATHSLAGHNGAIYALAWSPKTSHILASGAADGRVLFFDVRRANAAFASLDLDDATGVSLSARNRLGVVATHASTTTTTTTGSQLLDYAAQAHAGPVTSVQWTPGGGGSSGSHHDKIVTAGHDQRIRVWDAATGRNELVHFGPRLKNARMGNFAPLIAPAGFSRKANGDVLLWANDDARGQISVYGLREGDVRGAPKQVGGVRKGSVAREREIDALRGRGRVNAMVWRYSGAVNAEDDAPHTQTRDALEMLSAHADGTVGVWRVPGDSDGESVEAGETHGRKKQEGAEERMVDGDPTVDGIEEDDNPPPTKKRRKNKQDFSALVEGLTRMR